MKNYKQSFNAANPNFWARLLIFAFSVLSIIGIEFPKNPTELATDIISQLSTTGLVGLIGIIAISVIMPIYNLVRTNPKVGLSDFLNVNFFVASS